MGRLIKEALFSYELIEEHQLRMLREADANRATGEDDFSESTENRWEKLADRIRQLDPYGQRSRALLAEVESHP